MFIDVLGCKYSTPGLGTRRKSKAFSFFYASMVMITET